MRRPVDQIAKKPVRAALMRLLDSTMNPGKLDALVLALYNKARAGDTTAMSIIFERVEGRVPQPVGGAEELGPISVAWRGEKPAEDASIIPAAAAIAASATESAEDQRVQ